MPTRGRWNARSRRLSTGRTPPAATLLWRRSSEDLARRFATVDPSAEERSPSMSVLHWVGGNVLADSIAVSHTPWPWPVCTALPWCRPWPPRSDQCVEPVHGFLGSGARTVTSSSASIDWLCGLLPVWALVRPASSPAVARSRIFSKRCCWRVITFADAPSVCRCNARACLWKAARLRILCSAVAHFSVQQSAARSQVPSHDAVVPVAGGRGAQRMDPDRPRQEHCRTARTGAFADGRGGDRGATDFGSIDRWPPSP